MLRFALPNFVENYHINSFFHELSKTMPSAFKTNISFYIQQGSLPYHSWSGGVNSNVGNGVYYRNLVELQSLNFLPSRLNVANVLLEDYDFFDCFSQTALEVFNCGSTVLEISNMPLMDYIKSKYPHYRYVFSKQADLINEFTPELLNSIANSGEFMLIGIPDKHTFNLEWLKKLEKKSMYEITVNPICPANCPTHDVCLLKEHQNQLDYYGAQLTTTCQRCNHYLEIQDTLDIETILRDYKGFTYFTFNSTYVKTPQEWLDFYLNYFIKPECLLDVNDYYARWLKSQQQPVM